MSEKSQFFGIEPNEQRVHMRLGVHARRSTLIDLIVDHNFGGRLRRKCVFHFVA